MVAQLQLVALIAIFVAANGLQRGGLHQRVVLRRQPALRSTAFKDDVGTSSRSGRRSSEYDELAALRDVDVSHADNYYEATLPRTNKKILAAAAAKSMDDRIEIDNNFYALMNLGFERRLTAEGQAAGVVGGGGVAVAQNARELHGATLPSAAQYTGRRLELGKSKEEQLRDLKKQRLAQRSGAMKMVPQSLHKYIDYLNSLKIKPSAKEITKNVLFGAFFAFVTAMNGIRNGYMYMIVGHLVMLSSLLTRNIPPRPVTPGMDRNKKVATWSRNAFKTAAAITILYSSFAAAVSGAVVAVLPLKPIVRIKSVFVSCLLFTSYFSSFYEVYEDKGKNGWRWKKALDGNTLSAEDQAKLTAEVFGEHRNLDDLFNNSYDPEIDDYPPLPKYLDELEKPEQKIQGGSGELDEGEAKEHFDSWMKVRKEARRPPVEDAPPETPWVGSKVGMYVKNVPGWLNTAYQKNVLGANAWRGKPQVFKKDTKEFEPVPGPFGFRDKRPQWIQLFGTGVWEEKVQASRRAARAFGSYRKSMYKLDKQVVIRPCDGVELDGKEKDKQ